MQNRRGFTLVEVLVALGLLVVIASLALPVALTNTTSARAKTAERILKLAPNAARGEAQHGGLPVALVLLPSEDGQELRLAMVRQPDPESDSVRDQAADPDDISTWPTVDDPEPLPRGTALWDGEVAELEAFEAAAKEQAERGDEPPLDLAFVDDQTDSMPEGAIAEPVEPVVLAWFLSDGSAMGGGTTIVQLADGRVVRVRVEALTGRLVFTPAPELEAADEDEQAEADEPSDEPTEPEGPPADEAPSEGDGSPAREFDELEFDALEFDRLEFDSPEFDEPEFDQLEFEDLSRGLDRGGDGTSGTSDEPRERRRSQPESSPSRERTNPQPPQPR